jgi:hypothetical protein
MRLANVTLPRGKGLKSRSNTNPSIPSQVHQAFRIGHGDIMECMIGHSRTTPTAGFKSKATHTGLNIQATKEMKDRRMIPDILERFLAHVPGNEGFLLQEGTGVHPAFGRDTTGHLGCAAHVQAFPAPVFRGEAEKGVPGADLVMFIEPLGKGLQLFLVWTEMALALPPTPGRTKAGDSEFGTVDLGHGPQCVQLGKIDAGQYRVDAEGDPTMGQALHRIQNLPVRSFSSDPVIDIRRGAIQAYLKVEHLERGQLLGQPLVHEHSIGAHTGNETLLMSVSQKFQEVLPHKGFSAADVDLKDLQGRELIDQGQGLTGGQLPF